MSDDVSLRRAVLAAMGLGLLILAFTGKPALSQEDGFTPPEAPEVDVIEEFGSGDLEVVEPEPAPAPEWHIAITPRQSLDDCGPDCDDVPAAVAEDGRAINASAYERIYRSLPFIRAEYNANPSYRHETTMEILFGKLRPMTIYKNLPQRRPPTSMRYVLPYRYNRYLAPYGLNYSFYFPYWNARGLY